MTKPSASLVNRSRNGFKIVAGVGSNVVAGKPFIIVLYIGT